MNKLQEVDKRIELTAENLHKSLFEVNLVIKKRVYELTQQCEDLNFSEIQKLPLYDPYVLPANMCVHCDCDCNKEYIVGKIIEKDDHFVRAKVKFEPGVGIHKHFHSDVIEHIEVTEEDNVIIFETNGEVRTHLLHKGDNITIASGRVHQVYSMQGSTMLITFYKKEI